MATSSTQEEVRAAKIAAMGLELGELHFLLWHDVAWLHLKWQEFRELFATSESRIALMNKTAPEFFSNLERVLWQDVLLHLSRLSDPPGTGGQRNVSVRGLTPLVVGGLRGELNRGLDDFEDKTRFARDWRHRLYAHRDLEHAATPSARPLEPASRAKVEEALASLRWLMNLIEGHYQKGEVAYADATRAGDGAYMLLWYLDSGLEADEKRRGGHGLWRPRFK
ncbi:MAG: hypothetical protein Q8R92_14215 [Deltaproteobacteria bacterium]|nr:hypothetical protein [Deltaproteobacteria bacterium]